MTTAQEVVGLLCQGNDGLGLQHLQFLCENPDELCAVPGALEGVVKYTQRYMQNASVVAQACTVLNAASAARERRPAVAHAGGIQVLLRALLTHENDMEVVEEATAALRTAAGCTENRELLANLGGIAVILQLMQTHWGRVTIVDHCSYILWGVSVLSDNQRLLAKSEAVDLLVRALQEHESVPTIVENCCGALRNIARSGNDLRNEVINSGGVLAPLMALSQHPTSPKIAEQAFALLCTLAGSEGQSADQLKAVVAPYVLPALRLAMFSPRAVEQGCAVLWCIATVAALELANGGAVHIILQALQNHAHVAPVVEKACGALTNLGAVATSRQKMCATPDLLDLLVFSLRSHPTHPGVALQACRALSNLAIEEGARRALGRLNALPVVIHTLGTHKASPSIAEHACRLVARLALSPDSIDGLVESDLHTLLDTLAYLLHNQASTSARLAERVCMVIRNLSHILSSRRQRCGDLALAVVAAARCHRQEDGVLNQACAALRVLLRVGKEGCTIAEREEVWSLMEELATQEARNEELGALLDDLQTWKVKTARK